MTAVTEKEVRQLVTDPISFAMMMDDWQLEQVIVIFVSVLNKRRPDRGG
jgi:hypothetical protein